MRLLCAAMALWACAGSAGAQAGYSERQLVLARQIGAVIALVKRCDIVPMPTASIVRAMRVEGVPESALTRETVFRAAIVEQTNTMATIDAVMANAGTPLTERRRKACTALIDNYGPSGSIRPGLVPSR